MQAYHPAALTDKHVGMAMPLAEQSYQTMVVPLSTIYWPVNGRLDTHQLVRWSQSQICSTDIPDHVDVAVGMKVIIKRIVFYLWLY